MTVRYTNEGVVAFLVADQTLGRGLLLSHNSLRDHHALLLSCCRMIAIREDTAVVEAVEVGTLVVNPGQRYDVLLCQSLAAGVPVSKDPVFLRASMLGPHQLQQRLGLPAGMHQHTSALVADEHQTSASTSHHRQPGSKTLLRLWQMNAVGKQSLL